MMKALTRVSPSSGSWSTAWRSSSGSRARTRPSSSTRPVTTTLRPVSTSTSPVNWPGRCTVTCCSPSVVCTTISIGALEHHEEPHPDRLPGRGPRPRARYAVVAARRQLVQLSRGEDREGDVALGGHVGRNVAAAGRRTATILPAMSDSLADPLRVAVAAAREAGALIRQEFHRPGGPRGHGSHADIDAVAETGDPADPARGVPGLGLPG